MKNPPLRKPKHLSLVEYKKLFPKNIQNKHSSLSNKCKANNRDFNLTYLSLLNIKSAKKCHYLGIRLDIPIGPLADSSKATIDRKNPRLGYVKGNVVACSYLANQIKMYVEMGLIEPDDIVKFGEKLKQYL